MAHSSLCHARAKIFWQQNLPIKSLKIILNLNHAFRPVLVLIRSWDVTDVVAILGISVIGVSASLAYDRMSDRKAEDLLVELLGVPQVDTHQEVL